MHNQEFVNKCLVPLGLGPADEELFSPKLFSSSSGCTFLPATTMGKKVTYPTTLTQYNSWK